MEERTDLFCAACLNQAVLFWPTTVRVLFTAAMVDPKCCHNTALLRHCGNVSHFWAAAAPVRQVGQTHVEELHTNLDG